jgi:hypothetical protein
MTIIMGIDPGISGAVAFYFPMVPSRISVDDVPVAGGEINGYELARLIKIHRPTLAVIERVGAMPGNGGVSMFNFGRAYGDVRGVVSALDVPMHFVTPNKWKKHFGLTSDKEQSRLRAIRTCSRRSRTASSSRSMTDGLRLPCWPSMARKS